MVCRNFRTTTFRLFPFWKQPLSVIKHYLTTEIKKEKQLLASLINLLELFKILF
nr:MAG TPA_asm: hypothetical protein [Bacteriophage sp.]